MYSQALCVRLVFKQVNYVNSLLILFVVQEEYFILKPFLQNLRITVLVAVICNRRDTD